MNDFAAIDFETANCKRSSVCSVGIVIVGDGKVIDRFYRLIHPYPDYYTIWNTEIHGLTKDDTYDAPVFPEVWYEINKHISGLPLVAHNSVFDESCLKAAHSVYGLDYPEYEFYCTLRASRKIFGKTLPNHQLHTVAQRCGFDLEFHHNALADAEACAHIALQIL